MEPLLMLLVLVLVLVLSPMRRPLLLVASLGRVGCGAKHGGGFRLHGATLAIREGATALHTCTHVSQHVACPTLGALPQVCRVKSWIRQVPRCGMQVIRSMPEHHPTGRIHALPPKDDDWAARHRTGDGTVGAEGRCSLGTRVPIHATATVTITTRGIGG